LFDCKIDKLSRD